MRERQLTLDLTTPPALGRADFLPAPANAEALALIDNPGGWPQGRLLIVGPDGSGKSHLAAFWSAENGARRVSASALRPDSADLLVAPGGALVIENAHRAGGAAGAEQSLFHIWNLAAERDCLLLMTARTPPRDWGLSLPDLASRMGAMPVVRLGMPDDALLGAVLVKLFADRQLHPAAGVIEALLRRMDRDLGLARRLVAAIDRNALAEGRAVTRPLALASLAALTGEADDEGEDVPDPLGEAGEVFSGDLFEDADNHEDALEEADEPGRGDAEPFSVTSEDAPRDEPRDPAPGGAAVARRTLDQAENQPAGQPQDASPEAPPVAPPHAPRTAEAEDPEPRCAPPPGDPSPV
ncbi:hypothetical protein [Paracoccus sp. Z118]|uniref:hypothetical protein n=1 Tax=Paracoccus sp. Z118 TaxID=2851017 RepID=UPI0020B878E2|nr:hypothetical protein [Paracoccus sp. Z118]